MDDQISKDTRSIATMDGYNGWMPTLKYVEKNVISGGQLTGLINW